MKTLIASLLSFALLAVALPALGQRIVPTQLKFSGVSVKEVSFSHEKHQTIAGDCKACHHMGVGTGNCTSCHGRDNRFSSKKDAFHASCIGCHTKTAVSAASDCLFCHKDPNAGTSTQPDPVPDTGGKKRRK